ncbi:MAG: sphingomyelin synthase family protein [Chitinophagales bacterium]|nr:sphingomyelin synthase family protein [Chitinophagales bacterium]MDW8418021.1 phosphatase PAP2-related protein [Chitinophagales bacterium]
MAFICYFSNGVVMDHIKATITAWREAFSGQNFRNQFAISVLVLTAVMSVNSYFLKVWQTRPGIQINDLFLQHLPPIDFSWQIFFLEYGCLLLTFLYVLRYPQKLVTGIQMFTLVFAARTLSIYLLPLEPPRNMILLHDPIANFFFQTDTVYVTKDLFFSGHIAAMALFCLLIDNKNLRMFMVLASIVVAVMILWQHVHYTMDVLFAPLASYAAYRFVLWWHLQTRYGLALKSV